MALDGFPNTIPALNMTLNIGMPILVGSVSRGTPCTVVPMVNGTLNSEPSFGISLEASLLGTGNDYIHNDPGGKHMRLDTHLVFRDLQDERIYVKYKGLVAITPELKDILGASEHCQSTEFGDSFISVDFETGCEKYRCLETGLYVGAGRFVVNEARTDVCIEYKISQVVCGNQSGTGDEKAAEVAKEIENTSVRQDPAG